MFHFSNSLREPHVHSHALPAAIIPSFRYYRSLNILINPLSPWHSLGKITFPVAFPRAWQGSLPCCRRRSLLLTFPENRSPTLAVPRGGNSCLGAPLSHATEDAFPWQLRLPRGTRSFPVLQASSPKGPSSLRATASGWPPTCAKIPRKNPALN